MVVHVPIVKGHNCIKYFEDNYKCLSFETKKKVDYYKKFLLTNDTHIIPITANTTHDSNYDYYRKILEEYFHRKELKP